MVSAASHRCSVFCILPPHILEATARNGSTDQRDRALRTLSAAHSFRAARSTYQLLAGPTHRALTSLAGTYQAQRTIYSANNGTTLPGTAVRNEDDGATGDAAVDEAYDGMGSTYEFYLNIFQRNSIDNQGMHLDGTVHYGNPFDNALWNGTQMIFGDGDGDLYNRFTVSVDITGHEMTHGVTGATLALIYQGQPGALNESISDVFGSMVKQRVLNQTAAQADWLIGQGLFTAKVQAQGLRSMSAPGTAYNDPVIGKDPQPAHMNDYITTDQDNGGVHLNSGIPNRAFYLVATALGGYSWEKAGRIWYATLNDSSLSSTSDFQAFAQATCRNAADDTERQAVINAWATVGIHVS
jgi:Zn-dependent metalloprotease